MHMHIDCHARFTEDTQDKTGPNGRHLTCVKLANWLAFAWLQLASKQMLIEFLTKTWLFSCNYSLHQCSPTPVALLGRLRKIVWVHLLTKFQCFCLSLTAFLRRFTALQINCFDAVFLTFRYVSNFRIHTKSLSTLYIKKVFGFFEE